MLEKNENISYFDAHFHLADCIYDGIIKDSFPPDISACTCSHSKEEWELTERFRNKFGMTGTANGMTEACHAELVSASKTNILNSYGLHPQSAGHIDVKANADFLEKLLQQNKLHAIGETGFDYFTADFRQQAEIQEEMFNIQLQLALKYNMPLIIHCRKANEKLFEYSKELKKLPSVLFHSFMGMPNEARALNERGIKAYFSFGKQVMNNNKKVIACVKELPQQVLLTETDAPWQFLKGQNHTDPEEIKDIFQAFCKIRKSPPQELQSVLRENFYNLFCLKQ